MSQFKLGGMTFMDSESLYHGIGKGSGRGRPIGSRNGIPTPGAAFMRENYQYAD